MSFVFKKKVLSSILAATMAAGFAATQNAAAVHLSEDGIGQVLLAPLYLADFGYKTKFAIVNTRTDVAVKAKVVLRSKLTSAEVIDFICYLTPGDVCRFEVRNENGKAILYSDDDSVKNGSSWASINPVRQELFTQNLGKSDTAAMGHLEVVGAYGARGSVILPDGTSVRIFRTMAKPDLARVFDTDRAALSERNPEIAANGRMSGQVCTIQPSSPAGQPCEFNSGAIITDAVGGSVRSTDPTWVRLLGYAELQQQDGSDRMGYRIPALAGEIWDNVPMAGVYPNYFTGWSTPVEDWAGVLGARTFDGRVISNKAFEASVNQETGIGANFGGVKRTTAGIQPAVVYDNIIELEHALAVTNIKGSFEDDSMSTPVGVNRTQLAITFPTKYRHFRQNPCGANGLAPQTDASFTATGAEWSPPFQVQGPIEYTLRGYDNQENTRTLSGNSFSGGPKDKPNVLSSEVNYFLPSWPATQANGLNFESGWFNMQINPVPGCSYRGAPLLAFAHKYMVGVNGAFKNSLLAPLGHVPELSNGEFPPNPPAPTNGEFND